MKHPTRELVSLLLAAALCACDAAPAGAPTADTPPTDAADDAATPDTAAPPEDVGPPARQLLQLAAADSIPGLAAQPTDRGRRIGGLAPFAGRVYLGYGDFADNTGPIAPVAWDPLAQAFFAADPLPTEELLRFTVHGGALYAADIDPDAHQGLGGAFRLAGAGQVWTSTTPIAEAVHTFDVASFDGRLYATTGCSPGASARVASTDDGGATWLVEHSTPAPPGDGFSRYYYLGAASDRLFVSGRLHAESSTPAPFAWVRDLDGAWTAVTGAPAKGLLVPLALGEDVLVAGLDGDPGKGGDHTLGTWWLDGDQLTAAADPPTLAAWYVQAGSRAWVLSAADADGQRIWLVEDLRADAWELILDLPALDDGDAFSAIAWLDDALYLGTLAGDLWVLDDVL